MRNVGQVIEETRTRKSALMRLIKLSVGSVVFRLCSLLAGLFVSYFLLWQ